MQSLTRNPLAEPGLMGVNAGAAVAVIGSVVVFGVMGIWQYMVAATIGGALAAVLVYTLGRGRDGSIVKLALAGVAISAALSAIAQGLILADQDAYNEFRVWVAGSLEGRGMDIASTVGPVIVLGMLVAFFVAPAINALSMGEEAATSLGVSVRTTQNLTLLAVTVLAGAATAAVGPIGFVGLAVPFVVRALLGNDVRWVNYGSALLGPVWLLCADVLARVLVAPQETQVGIVATLAGAPVFLFLMTRRKVEAL
jgi:ferric enterobactin transport system permease protein fepD